jgi:hypothetical protein
VRRPKTLKAAKARAWKAISAHVRQKAADGAGYVACVTCASQKHWKELHCGHFQHGLTAGKDADGKAFVWIENLHPQCAGCNTYRGGMLDKYTLYMIDMYGRGFTESLQIERSKPVKMSIDDWWDLEKEYSGESINQMEIPNG